jgi:Zn-dependent M28 family amino/carboxypeptidase
MPLGFEGAFASVLQGRSMRSRMPTALVAVLAALVGGAVLAPVASALDEVNTSKLRKAVTVNGILRHERALQFIANANGGTRVSGTAGFDASADYVRDQLVKAGYKVTVQDFEFPFFDETAPPVFERVSPEPRTFAENDDFATMDYSGTGDATAPLVPVDVVVPIGDSPPSTSTSGCEAADFAGLTAGDIALMQRGTCSFAIKAANAEAAGASAAVIFNEGQAPANPGDEDRRVVLQGTLGEPGTTIPVVGTSYAIGAELVGQARAGGVVAHVAATTLSETRTTHNVIADSTAGDPDQVVVVGSHLDSVPAGPGINDNGSGTATDLEVAIQMAKLNQQPRRMVRFAFWGAEEENLLGSTHYVDTLTPAALSEIYANLNFDMLGSPNFVRFVYDGDGSDTPASGPPGSGQIEALFNSYFAGQGLATDPTPFDGRSDYGPFIAAGIPAGGLFSGAEGEKTAEQAAVYGGTAGAPYDPCYHQACDTINNLNTTALNQMGDGVAHATWTLARSRTGLFDDGSRTARKLQSNFRGPEALK